MRVGVCGVRMGPMKPGESTRLEATDLQLRWGNPARAKAEHREEARQRYLALPLSERFAIALSMVQPRREHRRP